MSYLLILILFIWISILHQKLDKISNSINLLAKKLYNEDNKLAKPEHNNNNNLKISIEKSKEDKPEPLPNQQPNIAVEEERFSKTKTIQSNETFDIQNMFLGNIFNKIGALAIIIAMVILAGLVSPYIVITPMMKFIFGIIAGCTMVGSGLFGHKNEKLKNYSEVLLGTGFATLFITSFCGYSLFHILNTTGIISIGAILLLAVYIIANKMKTISMLVIGLIGGYLTALFIEGEKNLNLSYIIFLNLASLIFTIKNKNTNIVNIINLIFTTIIFGISHILSPINTIFPIVLWGLYTIYDLFRNKENITDNIIMWLNYIILTIFTITLFHNSHLSLGVLFGTTSIVYLLLALCSRIITKTTQHKSYEYYVFLNIWFYILFVLNDINSVIAWSTIALISALISSKFNENHFKKISIWYFVTTFAGVLLARHDGTFIFMGEYNPIINLRLAIFGLPIVSMFISGYLLKNNKNYQQLLNLGAISLGYLYAICEINSFLASPETSTQILTFNKYMIYTILGFIYTLNTKKLYITTKFIPFNIISILIGIYATLMLIVGSYSYPVGFISLINLRFATYLFAIISCVMLSRWTKHDFYKYLAVILGFLLIHTESVGIHKLNVGMQYIISLSWVLYSGIITTLGIISNRKFFINSGITLIIFSILRIFIFDLANVDALYKLIAFLALGIILMFVSYIYTKKKN